MDDLDRISKVSSTLCKYIYNYKRAIFMENYNKFDDMINHRLHTKIKFGYIYPTYEHPDGAAAYQEELHLQCYFRGYVESDEDRIRNCGGCDRMVCLESEKRRSYCGGAKSCFGCDELFCKICLKNGYLRDGDKLCSECIKCIYCGSAGKFILCAHCGKKMAANTADVRVVHRIHHVMDVEFIA